VINVNDETCQEWVSVHLSQERMAMATTLDVWALFRETDRKFQDTDQRMKDTNRQI
jgi:hypothetical protein